MALTVSAPLALGQALKVRNVSPFAQPFGLLVLGSQPASETTFRLDAVAVNSFASSATAQGDLARLDGETAIYGVSAEWPLSQRWSVGVELPLVTHSGGVFDGFIDTFHDLFGFPDGGRPTVDHDRLDYLLFAGGAQRLSLTERRSGVGDLRVQVMRRLAQSPAGQVALTAQLKLPTGAQASLLGSGAADLALGIDWQRHLSERLSLTAAAAATWLGRSDLWPDEQRRFVGQGHFGVAWRIVPALEFVGQLDAHSSLYAAGPAQLQDAALLGTLGGRLKLGKRLGLELAVVEDLAGASVSDVTFQLGFTVRSRAR